MPRKEQQLLSQIEDPDNPGRFLAEEIHVYDGPLGSGDITYTYRILNDVVQVKAVHVGPEDRTLPLDWTDVDESPLEGVEKKTRIVPKKIVLRDANNKTYDVIKDDFEEVYFDPILIPNPSPARDVIAGKGKKKVK